MHVETLLYISTLTMFYILQFPLYGYTAYSSSKFALKGFTEVLQMEVKPHNIKVIVSYPPDTG